MFRWSGFQVPTTAAARINHVLLLGFFVFMVWFGARFAVDAWVTRSSVLGMPMTVLYGPIAFCFALMLIRYVQYVLLPPRSSS